MGLGLAGCLARGDNWQGVWKGGPGEAGRGLAKGEKSGRGSVRSGRLAGGLAGGV